MRLEDDVYEAENFYRNHMIDKIIKRAKIMKINLESRYLSVYIMDYYFKGNTRDLAIKKNCDVYAAGFLLLGSKMREVDTKTPYAVEIKRLKEEYFSCKEVKKIELKIAQYFDWNLHFLTLFDYLEHCTTLGILLSTDVCSKDTIDKFIDKMSPVTPNLKDLKGKSTNFAKGLRSKGTVPSKDSLEENSSSNNGLSGEEQMTERYLESDIANLYTPKQNVKNPNQKHLVQSNKTIKKKKLEAVQKTATKKTTKTDVCVEDLDQPVQKLLAKELNEKCLELAEKVMDCIPFAKFNQANMALAIVRYARRKLGIYNKTKNINVVWDTLFNIDNTVFLNEYDLLKKQFGDPKEGLLKKHFGNMEEISKDLQNPISFLNWNDPNLNLTQKNDSVKSYSKIAHKAITLLKIDDKKPNIVQKQDSIKSYIKKFEKEERIFTKPDVSSVAKIQYLNCLSISNENLKENIEVISNQYNESYLDLTERNLEVKRSEKKSKSREVHVQDEQNNKDEKTIINDQNNKDDIDL